MEFIPKKYIVISNKEFDKKFPSLKNGYGAYDSYIERGKNIRGKIFVAERALANKKELNQSLIHENFHRRERALAKKEYDKIERLDKQKLLEGFYSELKRRKMIDIPREKYMKMNKNINNHEILAEYSANFYKEINKPNTNLEKTLKNIWYNKKLE